MSDTATPLSSENIEIVDVKVFVDGTVIDNSYQITEVAIFKKLNKISKADIHFFDGDVAEGTFPIMESNEFSPGTPVSIEIGYGTGEENEIAFQGIIAQVDVQTHSERKPLFIVRCVDVAFKMTLNNQYYLYENKKDSDLFNDIIDRHKVDAGTIEATTYEHPSILQFGMSDWDLLLSRAKKVGHVVYSEDGKLNVKKPEPSDKSIQVTFGKDIIKQQLSFSARSIFSNVTATSWNATDQDLRSEDASEIPLPQQGDDSVDTASVAERFTGSPQRFLSHANLDTSVIADYASGQLLEYELSKIHGHIVIPGSNAPKVDSAVEILRMGNYFTGDGYISGVEHRIRDGNWTTKIIIGVKRESIYSDPAADVHPELGHILSSLQIGIVKQIHDDPAGNARILVKLPGFEGESEGIWARVLQRYATDGAGYMIYPEIGNEVILGFLNGDPQSPIVIGSLFSQTKATPFEIEEGNNMKSFTSREKLVFSFDEETKAIRLSTPGGNQLVLSDDQKGIRLEDQNGNVVELNDKGIALESQSDLILKTSGNITIEATGSLDMSSKSGDASIKAMNVKTNANMKIEGKANIIESNATAQAVIKGGIVQIN